LAGEVAAGARVAAAAEKSEPEEEDEEDVFMVGRGDGFLVSE
jgi:hypothetical protein